MLERGVVGMKRQWDERLEAAGFILHGAQFHQVIDAVLIVLHMAVEHRSVRSESDLMRQPRGVQPLIAVDLVVTNNVAHAVGKNLSPAAGQRIDTRIFQLPQRLRDGQFRALRQIGHLDHGEGFQVNLRKTFF